jgi:hypothetical protein
MRLGVGFGEVSPILRGRFSIALGVRPVQCRRPTFVQTGVRLALVEEGFEVGGHRALVGCGVAGRGSVVSFVGVDEDPFRLELPKCSVARASRFLSFASTEYRLTLVGLVCVVIGASLVLSTLALNTKEWWTAARPDLEPPGALMPRSHGTYVVVWFSILRCGPSARSRAKVAAGLAPVHGKVKVPCD